MQHLNSMQLTLNDNDFPLAQAFVAQYMLDGWQEDSLANGEKTILVHSEDICTIDALVEKIQAYLPTVKITRDIIEQEDWHNTWKAFFTPVFADKFVVLPPWEDWEDWENRENFDKAEHIPIRIEPKSAFGTGHHMSTELCLRVISQLHKQGKIKAGQRFLDLGTGTGILGIACCKLGLTGLGLDIDPNSITNAIENIELNSTENFEVRAGSIQNTDQKYAVIIANILANPLKEMAEAIMDHLEPNGVLILSGFLEMQYPDLEKAYTRLGKPQVQQEPRVTQEPSVTQEVKDPLQNYPSSPWCSMYWS